MAEYDLFDLSGLPFDPPEKVAKKVIMAIEKKEKELGGALGNVTQQLEREEILEKLAFLKAKKSEIFTPDEKLNSQYEVLAKKRTDSGIENLKAIANLLRLSGKHVITNGTVRSLRKKTKLSKDKIEKVYLNEGFTISEIDPLSAMPKFPTNANKIYNELAALRKSKDPNPNGVDLKLAIDMYAFIAYLQGEPENSVEYRSKTSTELVKILEGFSKQYSTRNDNLGKLCASLATAGKMYIFNTDENRRAYEAHLRYKSPVLSELFATLKGVSEEDKIDPKFADVCIKQISGVFGDGNVALAIYNHEAGLKDEPYIPDKAVFYVKCAHCQNIVEFVDVAEAQKSNKCTHCGKGLYQQCKGCKAKILVSADRCSECGFVFANIALFSKYMTLAEEAFRRSNFDEARQHLVKAQLVDPGEKKQTNELLSRIAIEEARYEKPLNELRHLLAKKKFQAAADTLASIIKNFPRLNVVTYEKQINTTLAKAQSLFDGMKKLTPYERADACLDILDICEDFKPAIDFLRITPLSTIKNLNIAVDKTACRATISWSRSSDRGVTYCIVRKEGKDAPKNEMDGQLLKDGIIDTIYRDENLSPGTWYSYSVIAKRMGVCSLAVGKTIILLADVTDVHYEQLDTTLRITWNTPKNCTGVKISRTYDGKEFVLTENSLTSFEDKGVEYNKTYSYTLRANYYGLAQSDGVRLVVTPMVKIDRFDIYTKQVKDNKYNISWEIRKKGIDIRVLVNNKTFIETKSDKGGCDIELPAEGFYTVEVSAFSSGSWLTSKNSVLINTYTPCEIDRTLTQIRENKSVGVNGIIYNIELSIKILGAIPKNVVAFWYVVRTKSSPGMQAPWVDVKEVVSASASDVYKVSIGKYQKEGQLQYTRIANDENEYYVTFFTVFNVNGEEIISPPHKQRFNRPLNADVFWKVSRPFFGKKKVSVEIKSNRPFMRQPKLVLCSCSQDQYLLSHIDAKAEILMELSEVEFDFPRKIYKQDYEISSEISSRLTKKCKLFLFEAEPVSNENYTLRKAE